MLAILQSVKAQEEGKVKQLQNQDPFSSAVSYHTPALFFTRNIIIYKFKKKDRKNLDLDKDVKRSTGVILFSGFCEDYRKAFLCS